MSGQKPSAKVETAAEQVLTTASLTFRERFMRVGIIGAGGKNVFHGSAVLGRSLRQLPVLFGEEVRERVQNHHPGQVSSTDYPRKQFYELHNVLAHKYEELANASDQSHGIKLFRKTLLKFASGVEFELIRKYWRLVSVLRGIWRCTLMIAR